MEAEALSNFFQTLSEAEREYITLSESHLFRAMKECYLYQRYEAILEELMDEAVYEWAERYNFDIGNIRMT